MIKLRGYPDLLVKRLKILKKDFSIKKTKSTVSIEVEGEKHFFTQGGQSKRLLFAFMSLKRQINDFNYSFADFNKKEINYINFNHNRIEDVIGLEIDNCECYDINSAYLSVLKNNEIIDDKLYKRINGLPKKQRLKCLGMLATIKIEEIYKGGKKRVSNVVSDDNLRGCFFYCSSIVDNCLTDIFNKYYKYILFYWVDGIFISKDAPKKIKEGINSIFKEYGFEVKKEEVEYYKIKKINSFVVIELKKDGKIKNFNVKKIN